MFVAKVSRYSSLILFIGIGALGFWGGVNQWNHSDTPSRLIQTASQFAFGSLALIAAALSTRRRKVPGPLEWAWTISMGFAGGSGPVVWAESGIAVGLAGCLAGTLIAVGTLWLARQGVAKVPDA